MRDRQPTPGKEGRFLVTPEDGSPPFYVRLEMADDPLDDGDPLNKSTLLSDTAALSLGLDTDAVPSDAFLRIKSLIEAAESVTAEKARIVTGSYTGNGSSGLRRIRLESPPKFFFLVQKEGSADIYIWITGVSRIPNTNYSNSMFFNQAENYIEFGSIDGIGDEMNKDGVEYLYLALL